MYGTTKAREDWNSVSESHFVKIHHGVLRVRNMVALKQGTCITRLWCEFCLLNRYLVRFCHGQVSVRAQILVFNFRNHSFLFCFVVTSDCAQVVLLNLCSKIIPGRPQASIWGVRDCTWICCLQKKHLTLPAGLSVCLFRSHFYGTINSFIPSSPQCQTKVTLDPLMRIY